MSTIKNILLTIGVWLFALFFTIVLGFWILTRWLRDYGPNVTKPFFVWLAGPSLK